MSALILNVTVILGGSLLHPVVNKAAALALFDVALLLVKLDPDQPIDQ